MTISITYSIILVAVVCLCTAFTRAFPFLIFGRNKETPEAVKYVGNVLPAAVIAILVVYCLRTFSITDINTYVPQFIAIAAVVLLHLWKRNNLLSIGGGTVLYMVLVQAVFV